MDWSPSGEYFSAAAAGSVDEVRVYSFDGSSATLVDSVSVTDPLTRAQWSQDGKYLVTFNASSLYLFKFDGTSLTTIDSSLAVGSGGSVIIPSTEAPANIAWRPDGKFIAKAGTPGGIQVQEK